MAATTYRAAQVTAPGRLEIVERELVPPPPGTVRIRVDACGVCHSDSHTIEGHFPGMQFPRVPGHEAVGTIDAVAPDVVQWSVGQRAGVGWNGGYCGHCTPCRRGQLFACVTHQATGVTFDGGYAEYVYAPASAVALCPDKLDPLAAAPILCAGLTTFNALRSCGARAGDVVAVLGIGGLGHLAVQYANRMGFYTVAIARGQDKAEFAHDLGADVYIDSRAQDPAKELQQLGGAKAILATVTVGDAMSAVQGGLAIEGRLIVIGVAESMTASPMQLLMGNRAIQGWYSGTSIDSEDTLRFSARTNVRSMNEVYPLERVTEAYARMMSGQARFRVVLDMRK
jgi:D-arabinose 1-dehydrogenase-like Zn-dependent alcohol dehydrogenase